MNGRQDQEEFFNGIYGAHHRALHSFLFGKTGDAQVALDLLQETFLRAWQNLCAVRQLAAESQGYWLFTIARNLTTDYFRKCGRQSVVREELMVTAQEGGMISSRDAHAIVAGKEELRFIQAAIGRLPEQLRTIFAMSVLGGLSSKEISDRLEMPAGTVRYQLSMARKQLAQNFQAFEKNNIRSGHANLSIAT